MAKRPLKLERFPVAPAATVASRAESGFNLNSDGAAPVRGADEDIDVRSVAKGALGM